MELEIQFLTKLPSAHDFEALKALGAIKPNSTYAEFTNHNMSVLNRQTHDERLFLSLLLHKLTANTVSFLHGQDQRHGMGAKIFFNLECSLIVWT